MILFFVFQVLFGAALLIYVLRKRRRIDLNEYLQEFARVNRPKTTKPMQQVIDVRSLIGLTLSGRIRYSWLNLLEQLGRFAKLKLITYVLLLAFLSYFVNENFLRGNIYIVGGIFIVGGLFFGLKYLEIRREKEFDDTFPVALNMMTSAVSSGESLTQAIAYVGSTLDGRVAQEFSNMAKRLQLGEPPEEIFRKACGRMPYSMFFFFIMTLRANMERGGQLRDIIQRLNRLMFNIRSVDKKKNALTAEARMSVKIVAAIPFIFLIIMRFLSPDNYEFVMDNPDGRILLYYMLTSEAIGIGIVWGLMRNAR